MTLSPALTELNNFIAARVPYIWVLTHEEQRFVEEFNRTIVSPKKLNMSYWSMTNGLTRVSGYRSTSKENGTELPLNALKTIASESKNATGSVYIMKDLFLSPPEVRFLRDQYEEFADAGKCLIIVSPFLAHMPGGQKEGIPPTLEKQICVVEYGLPNYDHILQRIRNIVSAIPRKKEYSAEEMDEFARALRGLTAIEIDNAIATCVTENKGEVIAEYLIQFKRQSIRKSQILEFMDTDINIDDVGGLDKVKEYFGRYKNCFSQEAVDFGLEPLKLVLLTGVPGVGKSLTCKSIGHLFKLPLLKLDMGRLFGSLVGSSEQRTREMISTLEASAPVVCMVDEIEKGLSGTKSSNQSDSGTTSRVFGTLLTAIQDGLKDVILIATANDITTIPPEFIRRANEVFFVDLPSPNERWEILRIHIEKRGRKFEKYLDIRDEFLRLSNNFTGAEIEKTVKDAIARAFYNKSKDLTGEHILDALTEIKPIAQVMEQQIRELQEWAKSHARYASSYSEGKISDGAQTSEIEKPNRFKKLGNLN